VTHTADEVVVTGSPGPESLRRWREACAECHLSDSIWLPRDTEAFSATLRRRRIDDLMLVELAADPYGCRFEPKSSTSEYIGVRISSGTYRERAVLSDRRKLTIEAEFGLWDNARLVETEFLCPVSVTVLMIPKKALGQSRGGTVTLPAPIMVEETPATLLLKAFLVSLTAEDRNLGLAAKRAARNAVLELILAATSDVMPAPTAAVSSAMRDSIVTWVDQRLHLGEMSPAEVADCHGISVRSLHRLFAGTGETFGALVRNRRLNRARCDLITTTDSVQAIATRWGYADASHFIREFRRQHDVTPNGYRRGTDRRLRTVAADVEDCAPEVTPWW